MQGRFAENTKVGHWLRQGWQDFLDTRWISMGFSAIFVFIGLLAIVLLWRLDLGLVTFPLLTGFMVIAPILLTGYLRAARLLRQEQRPGFRDLLLGITEGTPGIWFLSFMLLVGYLIWVTDALIIYAIYFGVSAVPIDSAVLTDPAQHRPLLEYLFYSSLFGLLIAAMGFAIAAFSIPLILQRRVEFIPAVYASVSVVFRHPLLMLRWALTLALLTLLTLFLALPLLVVVLPVLAYASHAAYRAAFGDAQ